MNSQLQAELEATKDLDLLGYFIWHNLRQVSVTHADLKAHFNSIGIPEKLLLPEPSFEQSFIKACAKNDKTQLNGKTYLLRSVLRDKDRIVMAGVAEDTVVEDLEYAQEFKLILNRHDGLILSLTDNPIAKQIIQDYENMKGRLFTQEMCKQVLDIIYSMKTLHVRDRGGVYFVIFDQKEMLDKVEQLVNELNLGTLYVLPQVNLAATRSAISKTFLENVAEDVQSFNNAIKEWEHGKNPHAKTLETSVQQIDFLKEKIKSFGRVLKIDVGQFTGPITTIEENVRKISQRKLKVD